jgi:hypothetical protein
LAALLRNKKGRFTWKYNTSKKRKDLCAAYCKHLREGRTPNSFKPLSPADFKRYSEKFTTDFPNEEIEAAQREGIYKWEDIGFKGASGKIKGFNVKGWSLIMQNKFGWSDKAQVDHSGTNTVYVIKSSEKAYTGQGETLKQID